MKLLLLFVALISSHMAFGSDSTFRSEKQTVYQRGRTNVIQKSFTITSRFWFSGDTLYAYTRSGADSCGGSSRIREVQRITRRKNTTVVYDNLDAGKVKQVKVVWHENGQIAAIYFYYSTGNITSVGYF